MEAATVGSWIILAQVRFDCVSNRLALERLCDLLCPKMNFVPNGVVPASKEAGVLPAATLPSNSRGQF